MKSIQNASNSIAKASVWQLSAKLVNAVTQLGFAAILARILTPSDYGIVAVIMVFVGAFSLLSDIGFSTAVIQYSDLGKKEHDSLFFCSLMLSIVMALLFVIASFGLAIFYDNEVYVPLGFVLTISVVFNSLNMVPNGLLIKEKKFKSIACRLVFSSVVSSLVTVLLAYLGYGVFAIALNSVLMSAIVFIWNEISVRLVPRIVGSLSVLKRIGRYSAFRFGDQIIVYFASNLGNLLCGKFFGSASLGYYDKAYTFAAMPSNYLIGTITSTLHPFFTELKGDQKRLWGRFFDVVKIVSLLSMFCCVEMSICADELITLVFGAQWLPAIPLLQVLAFWIYPRSLNSVHTPLLLSLARSDLLFLCTSVNTAITAMMILFGVYLGSVETMADCITVAYFIELALPIALCIRVCMKRSILRYCLGFAPEFIAAIACLVLSSVLLPQIENDILTLCAKSLFVLVIYLGVCLMLKQGKYLKSGISAFKRR